MHRFNNDPSNIGSGVMPSGENYHTDMLAKVEKLVAPEVETTTLTGVTSIAGQTFPLSLTDLTDVDNTGVVDNDKLKYNQANGQYEPVADILNEHEDVNITAPVNNEVLTYSGGNWINAPASVAPKEYGALTMKLAGATPTGIPAPMGNCVLDGASANVILGSRSGAGTSGFRYIGPGSKSFMIFSSTQITKDANAGQVVTGFYRWTTAPAKLVITTTLRSSAYGANATDSRMNGAFVTLSQDEEIEIDLHCITNNATTDDLNFVIREV